MDEAVKSRPQQPSQCAPTEYPNAGKREQGIEGSFSLREFPWEHAYRTNILDPQDRLSRRSMMTPWRMVAFKLGEHGRLLLVSQGKHFPDCEANLLDPGAVHGVSP
jgi:hypothetical protein